MNEKLTAEQRVLQELIDYQCEYKEQTQDYAPGNRYWADKFMTIIGKAKQALTAHTVPEGHQTGITGNTEPEDGWNTVVIGDTITVWNRELTPEEISMLWETMGIDYSELANTEPEDGEKGLPKLIEEAHRLNNELTAVLIMLNKYKISAPSKE